MKKILLAAAVLVIVVAMAGGALAAGSTTANVSVTAAVRKVCANGVDGSIGSGTPITIDPTAGTTTYTGTDATVQCTKNFTTVSITAYGLHGTYTAGSPYTCAGSGTYSSGGFQLSDGTSNLSYNFACNASVIGAGFTGAGIDRPLGTSIQIIGSDAAGAVDNNVNYTDTVTLTINF